VDPEVKGAGVHPSKVVLAGLEAMGFPLQSILNHHLEQIGQPVLKGDPGADPWGARVECREGSEGLQEAQGGRHPSEEQRGGQGVLLGDPVEMQVDLAVLLEVPVEMQVGQGVLLVDQHWEVGLEGHRMRPVEVRQRVDSVNQGVDREGPHPSEGQREGQGQ